MTGTSSPIVPARAVFEAFGASETPERMVGGRGLTWRSGHVVVRPVDGPEEAVWKSQVLTEIDSSDEFTFPRPIPDVGGNWVHEGWQAIEWIPGVADETRVGDIVRAGEAFHRAIAGLARPVFIAESNDPWSKADRIAWGDATLPADEDLELLVAEYGAINTPSQVAAGIVALPQ